MKKFLIWLISLISFSGLAGYYVVGALGNNTDVSNFILVVVAAMYCAIVVILLFKTLTAYTKYLDDTKFKIK
jgi:hypothetical protein